MRRIIIGLVLLSGSAGGLFAEAATAQEKPRLHSRVPAVRGKAPIQEPVTTTGQSPTGEPEQQPPGDASEHQFVGEIRMFAGNYAPQGWALCDGRLLPIHDHQLLFSVMGTRYGGDGRTSFGLPDLRGQLGVSFIIALEGRFPPRS